MGGGSRSLKLTRPSGLRGQVIFSNSKRKALGWRDWGESPTHPISEPSVGSAKPAKRARGKSLCMERGSKVPRWKESRLTDGLCSSGCFGQLFLTLPGSQSTTDATTHCQLCGSSSSKATSSFTGNPGSCREGGAPHAARQLQELEESV